MLERKSVHAPGGAAERLDDGHRLMGPRIELPPATRAFGGDLTLGCDELLDKPRPFAADCLAFSHGRAALGWVCGRIGPFDHVVLSAYTCPTVPEFFKRIGVELRFVEAVADQWERAVRSQSGRLLVLVPAFLGHEPEADLARLGSMVAERGVVIVDALQTAFGHETIQTPDNVAVISGPRKCTALADGAILRWTTLRPEDRREVAALPWALDPVARKIAARALGVGRSPEIEREMLALTATAERSWPKEPHRMSDSGLWGLSWIDPVAHMETRWRNWTILAEAVDDVAEVVRLHCGTPFNLSILADGRDALLRRLRAVRVFATALWPDAIHSAAEHPRAEEFARRLVGLPIDQRYSEEDMIELASRVRRALCQ